MHLPFVHLQGIPYSFPSPSHLCITINFMRLLQSLCWIFEAHSYYKIPVCTDFEPHPDSSGFSSFNILVCLFVVSNDISWPSGQHLPIKPQQHGNEAWPKAEAAEASYLEGPTCSAGCLLCFWPLFSLPGFSTVSKRRLSLQTDQVGKKA